MTPALATNDAEDLLNEIARLMELNGENSFKVRAFQKAAETLGERKDWRRLAQEGTLSELPGIGKGIEQVLVEYATEGKSEVRDALLRSLPHGLVELVQIQGVGPKKARLLIQELGITSAVELEYACRENRLASLRGFGVKAQQKILEGVTFYNENRGQWRLSEVWHLGQALHTDLALALGEAPHSPVVSETGALRRKTETLVELEYLVGARETPELMELCQTSVSRVFKHKKDHIPVRFHFCAPKKFGYELARTTGSNSHWEALGAPAAFEAKTEEDFFSHLNLSLMPPETRETGEEVELSRGGHLLADLLPWEGIRGVFHNHTTRSDGSATLEEMVLAAKALGYEYIGISDHSQSAVYARGLLPDILNEQEIEIRKLQEKYPEIRIFWGIESDILADGSLDYDEKVLKRFDFVIASVHSRFGMDRHTMTQRILEAIRNPYTRFIGHITGRLLLGRKAYELEMEALIEEAARHNVAIELNANPQRLDIDWRWGKVMRENHTLTSINPDAHSTEGLQDTWYGIAMARKALLPKSLVVNSRSTTEVEKWLKRN